MLSDGRINKTYLALCDGFSNWLPVVAVLAPRATPPQDKEKSVSIDVSRAQPNKTISKIVSQTSSLDWKNIIPFHAIVQDKPWNLHWVRWVLWFACTMFLIHRLKEGNDLNSDQAVFLVLLNWCLAWAVAFSYIIKPERFHIAKLLGLILPSICLTVVLLVTASKVHFLNSIYLATADYSLIKKSGAILVTVFIQQMILAAPFAFIYIKRKQHDPPTTTIYYGMLAGLAASLVPLLTSLIQQKWYSMSGSSLGIYQNQSFLMLLLLPDGAQLN